MIVYKKIATQIRKILKEKYNGHNFNIRVIYKIMLYMRKCISEYLYNIYNTENISTNEGHNIYAVDESLFSQKNNMQLWVVGIVYTTNKSLFRCNYTKKRNSQYLRIFITKDVMAGNTISTDE